MKTLRNETSAGRQLVGARWAPRSPAEALSHPGQGRGRGPRGRRSCPKQRPGSMVSGLVGPGEGPRLCSTSLLRTARAPMPGVAVSALSPGGPPLPSPPLRAAEAALPCGCRGLWQRCAPHPGLPWGPTPGLRAVPRGLGRFGGCSWQTLQS